MNENINENDVYDLEELDCNGVFLEEDFCLKENVTENDVNNIDSSIFEDDRVLLYSDDQHYLQICESDVVDLEQIADPKVSSQSVNEETELHCKTKTYLFVKRFVVSYFLSHY